MLTNLIYGFTLFTGPIVNNISRIIYQQNVQTCSLYIYVTVSQWIFLHISVC